MVQLDTVFLERKKVDTYMYTLKAYHDIKSLKKITFSVYFYKAVGCFNHINIIDDK